MASRMYFNVCFSNVRVSIGLFIPFHAPGKFTLECLFCLHMFYLIWLTLPIPLPQILASPSTKFILGGPLPRFPSTFPVRHRLTNCCSHSNLICLCLSARYNLPIGNWSLQLLFIWYVSDTWYLELFSIQPHLQSLDALLHHFAYVPCFTTM